MNDSSATTSAPLVGVVGLPALAAALQRAGYRVVTGHKARDAATAIRGAIDSHGVFPLFVSDTPWPGLRAWTNKAANDTTVVVVHGSSGTGTTFTKVRSVTLPATLHEIAGTGGVGLPNEIAALKMDVDGSTPTHRAASASAPSFEDAATAQADEPEPEPFVMGPGPSTPSPEPEPTPEPAPRPTGFDAPLSTERPGPAASSVFFLDTPAPQGTEPVQPVVDEEPDPWAEAAAEQQSPVAAFQPPASTEPVQPVVDEEPDPWAEAAAEQQAPAPQPPVSAGPPQPVERPVEPEPVFAAPPVAEPQEPAFDVPVRVEEPESAFDAPIPVLPPEPVPVDPPRPVFTAPPVEPEPVFTAPPVAEPQEPAFDVPVRVEEPESAFDAPIPVLPPEPVPVDPPRPVFQAPPVEPVFQAPPVEPVFTAPAPVAEPQEPAFDVPVRVEEPEEVPADPPRPVFTPPAPVEAPAPAPARPVFTAPPVEPERPETPAQPTSFTAPPPAPAQQSPVRPDVPAPYIASGDSVVATEVASRPEPTQVASVSGDGKGEVVVVWAGKGGVGKTTTSVGLAQRASEAGLRVILIDGNFGQGDIRVFLRIGMAALPNVYNYAVTGDLRSTLIDPQRLNDSRVGQAPLRFAVVTAPPAHLVDGAVVTPETYLNLVQEARQICDLVVIDTQIIEPRNDEDLMVERFVNPLLRAGAWSLGVADPSSAGISNLLSRLRRCAGMNVPRERQLSMLNRAPADLQFNVQGVADAFGEHSVFLGIVYADTGITDAMNRGQVPGAHPTIAAILSAAVGQLRPEWRHLAEQGSAQAGPDESARPTRRGILGRLRR